jgi:hypothetical protein
VQKPVVFQLDEQSLQGPRTPPDRFVYSHYFKPLTLKPLPEPTDPAKELDNQRQLLGSEIGWLFLDRTRIRPAGFGLGEHVQSMSLAPGEEVVVEQRTFSKREVTFEDQSEEEQQFDLELSSTLSTELSEGLERENSRSEQTTTQVGGSFGAEATIPVGDIPVKTNVKVDASYANTLNEGSRQTRRRSVKDSSTSSSKVASRYRAVHRTTFKVTSEQRFESTSKRTLRNPNQFSPLDVHYFKIMRRLELTQERYGVRLCWAPSVKDPAKGLRERIARERAEIVDRILKAVELPDKPPEPTIDAPDPKVATSEQLKAPDSAWGLTYDMSHDFDLAIPIPQDYVWDGDVEHVRQATRVWATNVDRGWGWGLQGDPWVNEGNLMVRIHVGVDWKKPPIGRRGDIFMQAAARFIGDPEKASDAYKEAYATWQVELAKWEAEVEKRLAEPRKTAEAEADKREEALLANLDPASELIDRVVQSFPEVQTDEPWELEFWGQIFDWDRAAYFLYPGWWARDVARDWTKDPSDFLNSSWAKLYVPIRPGFERIALRWMVAKVLGVPLDSETEQAIVRIDSELSDFRTGTFGDPLETPIGSGDTVEEKFLTLGRWSELLPTDGTHLEVVQGITSALDDYGSAETEASRKARALSASNEEQDIELKKRAISQIGAKGQLNVNVEIATEETANSANGS